MISIVTIEWDDKPLRRAEAAATLRNLVKAGQITQREARQALRRGYRRSSPPKSPPTVHVGNIDGMAAYAVDTDTGTVVIGPIPDGDSDWTVRTEFGGYAIRRAFGRGALRNYSPHPFMGPALERGNVLFPDLWANSIVE